MKRPIFTKDCLCHIYNRGVEKRNTFMEDGDYVRFIHYLFELNNNGNCYNLSRTLKINSNGTKFGSYLSQQKPRKLLVEILAFTLMPNHYHLILRQKTEKGISKFMQKLGTGYTMFFNSKHKRSGSLFQGKFKAILIDKDEYLIHLLNYIHFNPLKNCEGGSTSFNSFNSFNFNIEKYRWSSFLDYIGEKNFPSVTSREFLLNIFGSEEKYKQSTKEWLKEKDKNISLIKNIVLEN